MRFDQPNTRTAGAQVAEAEPQSSDLSETRVTSIDAVVVGSRSSAQVSEAATTHQPTFFISHSKNAKILNQIKSNLEFGGFSYKVAIETETTAIPIPEKIFGMMRDCNCAIVNVSADEQERSEDGSYGINANVLVEIGAAFLAYNQRVFCWSTNVLLSRRICRASTVASTRGRNWTVAL